MPHKKTTEILDNFDYVTARINSAAKASGLSQKSARLIVVTKYHPVDTIMAAIEAGVRDVGENYAEEASEKIKAIGQVDGILWHMIGHIQSRKADIVARHFDYVHTVDSLKLATRLSRFAVEYGRNLPILVECNVSGEEQKFGYRAVNENMWPELSAELSQIALLQNLEIRGLMTMPPYSEDAEKSRPYFRKLRELREFLVINVPEADWQELSMGTSMDYITAVEEGATMVRIGTAILGPRPGKV